MAASSSTAANPNNDYLCDVFINHRGPDVKKTFASHLYRRLHSYGLRVFLDYQELQEGENLISQIEGAIGSASVHVAIFSKTYAESKWCLDELVLMLQSGAPIIPVFYHVKPAELRWSKGVYAQALNNLEKKKTYDSQTHEEKLRYNSITIQNWRYALSSVAEISGLDLEAFNWDEGEMLDKLVELVLKKGRKTPLNVAKYPTGLDEKVDAFETTVLLESGRVQVLGITGFGGVGKTTLAKELFNRKNSKYTKSYFLSDVRENAKISLHSLQSKLLKGLIQLDLHIDNSHQGIEMLRKHLSSSQVLLVLDDVDHVDQVDALLPFKDVLRPDSLILITSRDKDVLTRSGVQESSIYKLTGLNAQHSKELFCSHAFCQPHPLLGFEHLVDQFLTACNGLPLSLKVLGALLYGKNDKSYWKDQLNRVQQILPNEIQKSLKISYDSLDREEQQIFLDIACFFIGVRKSTAIRIWDGSGWRGLLGFQNLESKCLVEVDSKYNIKMHDHLRDMGRDIANDSRLPLRLWRQTENINDLLEQSSIRTEVRGIRMLSSEYEDNDDEDASFQSYRLRKLQLLHTEDGLLELILRRVHSPKLLWLRWDNCPCSFLPSWIPMKNLRVLQVQGKKLESLWQAESQTPLQLRELKIWGPLSKFPDSIGQLKSVELIVVSSLGCINDLEKLPEDFCHLQSLKSLDLSWFSNMMSLPNSFGNLTNLKYLNLSHSNKLKALPDSFGNLRSLQHLNLSHFYHLKSLPDSFGNLANLEHLDLSESYRLTSLPASFGNLTNLEHLNLSISSELKSLPNSFGNLVSLKYLDLRGCSKLTISSETLGNISLLEYIDLTSCHEIDVLPSQVARQPALEKLYLGQTNIKELPIAIGDLINLEVLKLGSPSLKTLPPSLSDLRNLKELKLEGCKKLKCLPVNIGLLTQLTKLTVDDCPLKKLPFKNVERERETLTESPTQRTLSNVGSCMLRLQYLRLYDTEISEVSFSEDFFPNLEHLAINNCNDLIEVGTLPNALVTLSLSGNSSLTKIERFSGLVKLKKLYICGCKEVEELPSVETLVSLEELQTNQCAKLKRIWGLAQLSKLRLLFICWCPHLEELPGVEHLSSLERLEAYGCPKLQWGGGLVEQLRQRLKELHI